MQHPPTPHCYRHCQHSSRRLQSSREEQWSKKRNDSLRLLNRSISRSLLAVCTRRSGCRRVAHEEWHEGWRREPRLTGSHLARCDTTV
jgi:hypothetical protein